MSRTWIAGLYGNYIFTFLKNLHTVFHNGCTNLHSHQYDRRVPISAQPVQHLWFVDFNDGHYNQCEVVYHFSFDLHFSNS